MECEDCEQNLYDMRRYSAKCNILANKLSMLEKECDYWKQSSNEWKYKFTHFAEEKGFRYIIFM